MPRGHVIVAHGGAGELPRSKKALQLRLDGLREAIESADEVLRRNGTSLDAVEAAIMTMEDNPVFNAGYGSCLTLDGRVEMDASIMDGKSLSAGAVALLTKIGNPISAAKLVMLRTTHVFLAGESAQRLAEEHGLKTRSPLTKERLIQYRRKLAELERQGEHDDLKPNELRPSHDAPIHDTVGAVALDAHKNVAAATSTGGPWLKLPGRIGDTPIIGAGTYASNKGGACSGTGVGEAGIRMCASKSTVDLMAQGIVAQLACNKIIRSMAQTIPLGFGVIAVDAGGRVGAAHSTRSMVWGYKRAGTKNPDIRLCGQRYVLRHAAKT